MGHQIHGIDHVPLRHGLPIITSARALENIDLAGRLVVAEEDTIRIRR